MGKTENKVFERIWFSRYKQGLEITFLISSLPGSSDAGVMGHTKNMVRNASRIMMVKQWNMPLCEVVKFPC